MIKNYFVLYVVMSLSMVTIAQTFPYQNPSLTAEQRADDLLSRLTLEEKSMLMMNNSPAIPRLGIPAFNWWSEALHGVGRNGLATVFPACVGMACSFDDDLIEKVFCAVSDEARAKNTYARSQGKVGRYSCLSFWTPNVNIFRDPRWGRGQETYGEDPFMNGQMGLRVVRGLQGPENGKYLKLYACAKHFAVHSGPEKLRHSFNVENLPPRDLWETYLPAFKTLVQEGQVREVMCAYQRFEGDPCCGSAQLLHQILRDEWGFKGLVVSDCGAINDFFQPNRHGVSADSASATAKAVLSGTDVECGSVYKSLPDAVRRGEISEKEVDVSVRRLLKGRFELGDFDSDSLVEWTQIPMSVIASKEHQQLALEMAREQMVLLKNNGVLPLARNADKLIVMGPNAADSTMLWSIYFGAASHTVTPLEGIETKVGKVKYEKACDITSFTVKEKSIGGSKEMADGSTTLQMDVVKERTYTVEEIISLVEGMETIIFVGGISPNLEKEQARVQEPGFDNGDRTTIELPQVQRDILKALHDDGKRVIFVNCSGSAVALSQEQDETCDAIIQAWYAGEQGGQALADVIFGDYNPSGKLAVTFYKNDTQLPPFDDYHMNNRTYRYFQGQPLYPFGYGLSYTSYQYGNPQFKNGKVRVRVKNTGKVDGTEIVQVYIRRMDDVHGPKKSLRAYQRVRLKAGESKQVVIDFPHQRFENWDESTQTMRVVPGEYEILVGPSSDENTLTPLRLTLK